MSDTTNPGRLVLLSATHRVAPGLLSWPAWELLRGGAAVLAGDPEHPQLPHLRDADVPVRLVDAAGPGELARLLVAEAASATGPVVWLAGVDADAGLAEALAEQAVCGPVPVIEVLPASWDLPGARLLDLVEVMDRLRSPGGCPWDARQTHQSLVRYLVEEAYELVDAIDAGDREHLREELGDVLFQVAFHARVAQDHADDPFDIDDVAATIVDKLVRRHPHVFADAAAGSAGQMERNWDALKAQEKSGRESVTDGVPLAQPALALAAKLLQRTTRAGLDVPVPPVTQEPGRPGLRDLDTELLGDRLLAMVEAAVEAGLDPETALRAAALRHRDRVRRVEGLSAPKDTGATD